MAKPIEFVPARQDAHDELKRKIESAPVEHAAAVLSAYELLEELHTSGTLDLLRGAVGAGGEITKQASSLAAQPEAVCALRNLLVLGKLLGSIDPDSLHRLADNLSSVQQQSDARPPSLFGIFRRLSSANSRRALAVATGLLDSVGRELAPKP